MKIKRFVLLFYFGIGLMTAYGRVSFHINLDHLLFKYKKNHEKFKAYSYMRLGKTVVVYLKNYKAQYLIFYPIKEDRLVYLWRPSVGEQQYGRSYHAIFDTTAQHYTGSLYQYNRDFFKNSSRIYISTLEQDLLAEAIKETIAIGYHGKSGYFEKFQKNLPDPYAILFFIYIPDSISNKGYDSCSWISEKR